VAILVGNVHGGRNSVMIAPNSTPGIARYLHTGPGHGRREHNVCRNSFPKTRNRKGQVLLSVFVR